MPNCWISYKTQIKLHPKPQLLASNKYHPNCVVVFANLHMSYLESIDFELIWIVRRSEVTSFVPFDFDVRLINTTYAGTFANHQDHKHLEDHCSAYNVSTR